MKWQLVSKNIDPLRLPQAPPDFKGVREAMDLELGSLEPGADG